jgi:hypothetical protein
MLDEYGADSGTLGCGAPHTLFGQETCTRNDPVPSATSLSSNVIAGHRDLNPDRPIPLGEWYELLALEEAHGAEQLLIWQARAQRAVRERPYGIAPAYYHACAAQAAFDSYRPLPAVKSVDAALCVPTAASPTLDPACDALLQAMGVRERQKLAGVSYELIVAWQTILDHPGMTAQFTSPIGFAVAQMQRGNAPPPIAELDRWVEHARRADDRYQSWRHVNGPSIAMHAIAHEEQLEARVRALAQPGADIETLCEIARWIEDGAADTEVVERLHASGVGVRS